jgi:hypothetical protein
MAVGWIKSGSYNQTTAETWNGTSWTATTTPYIPGVSQKNYLTWVSCTSASWCMAVGYYYSTTAGANQTLSEIWNGSTWTLTQADQPNNLGSNQNNYLYSVSCVGANFCMAAGDYNSGSYYQSLTEESDNGTTGAPWTTVSNYSAAAQSTYLQGVSCVSATWCMAAGYYYNGAHNQTIAEAFTGSSFANASPVSPATDDQLQDISCLSAVNGQWCTAVGEDWASSAANQQNLTETWAGSGSSGTWTANQSANTSGNNGLYGVSCAPASWTSFCIAVGWTNSGPQSNAVGLHSQPNPPSPGCTCQPEILQWNGSTWSIIPAATTGTNDSDFLIGVEAIATTGQIWAEAVGYYNSGGTGNDTMLNQMYASGV